MMDSNEYWSPKQAIRAITAMERSFDLTWVEEPARRWDYRGLRLVRESVRAAVATGENLNGAQDFYALIAQRGRRRLRDRGRHHRDHRGDAGGPDLRRASSCRWR